MSAAKYIVPLLLLSALLAAPLPAAAGGFYFGIDAGPTRSDPSLDRDREDFAALADANGITGAVTAGWDAASSIGLFIGYRVTERTAVEIGWADLGTDAGHLRAEEHTRQAEGLIESETRVTSLRASYDVPLGSSFALFAQAGLVKWTRDIGVSEQVREGTTVLFSRNEKRSEDGTDPVAAIGLRSDGGGMSIGFKIERFFAVGYRDTDIDRLSIIMILGY